jgi:hypothetical protein
MIHIKKAFSEKLEDLKNDEVKYKIKLYHDNSQESMETLRDYIKETFPDKFLEIDGANYSFENKVLDFFIWGPQKVVDELLQIFIYNNESLSLLHAKSEYASITDFCQFIMKYCDVTQVER